MKKDEMIRVLEQANACLGACGNESAKFFISMVADDLRQQELPKYGDVINNLFQFFDDNTTYSNLIEQMNAAQAEISRMSNQLFRRKEKDDPDDIACTEDFTEFFTTLNMMLWILKPIARDAERAYEDRVAAFEEKKKNEAAEKEGK